MGEHRALGQPGGAAGVLQNHVDLPQVGNVVGPVGAVIGKQLLEGQVQIVHRHLAQLSGTLELGAHRRRTDRKIAQAADYHLPQPRVAHQAPYLRVQRRQVERDEDVSLTVRHLVLEHALGVERRIVDHRAAGLEYAEERDRVVRRIRQVQADVYARTDSQLLESGRGTIHQRTQFAVADDAAHEFERRTFRPARHGFVEDLLHRHQP